MKTIHVILSDGGMFSPSQTRCGLFGKKFAKASDVYVTKLGKFYAVLPSDPHRGPTCDKCRLSYRDSQRGKRNKI